MIAVPYRIDRWDQIPGAIAHMQAAGAHHRAVLMQALYRGHIAHYEVHRSTPARVVKTFMASACRPELLLIGDDDDLPTGPEGWGQAKRILRWARHVIIHAAAGRVEEYYEAVATAILIGRVCMVETTTEHMDAWRTLAMAARPDASVHVYVPSVGPHPVPLAREQMQ